MKFLMIFSEKASWKKMKKTSLTSGIFCHFFNQIKNSRNPYSIFMNDSPESNPTLPEINFVKTSTDVRPPVVSILS